MSFYDTQTYCGIVDMKVVVGICNKINFTKVWITQTYRYFLGLKGICVFLAYLQF